MKILSDLIGNYKLTQMFDIDHLYLASYNYLIVDDLGEQVATTSFNPNTEDGKFNSEYHQNRILDVLFTLLKDSKNSINSLYKSIDNDTQLITDIAELVSESGSTKELPYNFGTLHEQVIRKNDYITGKTGIGPFALNVTNQILTQLFDVQFKDTKFAIETGIRAFNHLVDVDDNYISSWLSAFINAHVDIVKDPYISKLNVNPYTYNMINLLIRSGYGDVALWFCAQPIIRDMAVASTRAKSQYTRDQEKARTAFAAEEYAVTNVVLNYLTESEIAKEVIDRYTISTDAGDVQVRINTVNWIRKNVDVLSEIAKNPGAKTVTVNGVLYDVKNVLKIVFYAWKTLEPKARALSNMVQYTKIDTRKHGKDLISINRYKDAYDKLFHPVDEDSSPWDISSLRRLEEGSWIGVKTDLAIHMPSMILGGQTFNANPEFLKAVFNFGNILSTTGGVLNNDALKLISRSLQTAVKSQYFVKYVEDNLCKNGQTASEYIRSLFLGSNSMANRLTRLKNQIETNPKYARLVNNHLINLIYSEVEEAPAYAFGKSVDKPAFVTVLNNVDNSKVNSELLMDGWEDLLRDEDYFVRRFANDLIVYSFFTSGEFKGWNKMFKYVPSAWILGQYNPGRLSYAEYIKDALRQGIGYYTQFFEDIIANNAFDSKLVHRVPMKNSDDTLNFIGDSNTVIKLGKPLTERLIPDRYILVREGNGRNTADYNLYKLIYLIPYDKEGNLCMPVYARIKKKGYTTKGYNVYEYGYSLGYGENENDAMTKFDVNDAINKALIFMRDNEDVYELSEDEHLARAVADVYLGKAEGSSENNASNISMPSIGNKTEEYGVQIDSNLIQNYKSWLENNLNGIVAYRVNKLTFNTPEAVENGVIGNPFDWQKYGAGKAVQMFYSWLTTGESFEEPLANKEFRQAIINRIVSSEESSPILYYKELGYPSHATVVGYLIQHKDLLQLQENNVLGLSEKEQKEAEQARKDCKGE